MICADCLKIAPISCGLPHAAKALWNGFARVWRSVVANLGQLG
jgi:hypothetical protein